MTKQKSKKPGIEKLLFQKERPEALPKYFDLLFKNSYEGGEERDAKLAISDPYEEVIGYVFEKKMEAFGVTKPELIKKMEEINRFMEKEEQQIKKGPSSKNPIPDRIFYQQQLANPYLSIDGRVGMDVDEYLTEYHGSGNFEWISKYDQFRLHDQSNGSAHWNLTYHRDHNVRSGSIVFALGRSLQLSTFVRTLGVDFAALYPNETGWNNDHTNWFTACGDDALGYPPSVAKVLQRVNFMVRSQPPGGDWRYWTSAEAAPPYVDEKKKDGWNTRWGGPCCWPTHERSGATLPPAQKVDINKSFPIGTHFEMYAQLWYEIQTLGAPSRAEVQYNLSVLPYMNIKCGLEIREVERFIPDFPYGAFPSG